MFVVPAWIRWSSFLFGFATVALLVQAANRAYVATQVLNGDAIFSVWHVNQTTRSLTFALICLTLAVLPPVLWAVTRRRDQ